MKPKGSSKGEGKAMAKMPTTVINRRLLFEWDHTKGFISEDIHGLIQIYNVCCIKDERACALLYDIFILDPVTTRHFSQFQLMWPHRRSRSSPFRKGWAAFCPYMEQIFDKTHDQMSNWRWDDPRAFRDQVDCSNPQTTSLGKVKRTGKYFSWYGSDDPRAEIQPPRCRQYKPGDFPAVRPLNWDEMIDDNDDDDDRADPGALSGERSRPGDGNGNDDCESDDDTQGSEKGTGQGKGIKDGKGKEKGKQKGNNKGKGIVE